MTPAAPPWSSGWTSSSRCAPGRRTRILEPGKTAALEWFRLDGLPEPMPPHERYLLGLLAAQLDGGEAVPPITTVGFEPEHRSARYGTARPH